MIFYALPGHGSASPVASVMAERATSARTYAPGAPGHTPTELSLIGDEGDASHFQPQIRDVQEDFEWTNPKTQREFIRLEQKVLAKKADMQEQERYGSMRRDRNSRIFADRYVRDYAEVQRLRVLSQKLAEIQKYLHPFDV